RTISSQINSWHSGTAINDPASEELSIFVELLHAARGIVHDVHASLVVDGNPARVLEVSRPSTLVAKCQEHLCETGYDRSQRSSLRSGCRYSAVVPRQQRRSTCRFRPGNTD